MKLFISYVLFSILFVSSASQAGSKHLSSPSNQSKGDIWTNCEDYEGYGWTENVKTSAYSVHSAKCEGQYQVWVTKNDVIIDSKSGSSVTKRTVVDHVMIGELKTGEVFSSGAYCWVNGIRKAGNSVDWSAVYYWKNTRKATLNNGGIRRAWVVNHSTKKIELASEKLMSSVVCSTDEVD